MTEAPYTEADARSLNAKIAEFAKTLTPGELALLVDVFRRATAESEEVLGHEARRASSTTSGQSRGFHHSGNALSWFTDYMKYLPFPEVSK